MNLLHWIDRIGRPVFIRIMLPVALVWLSWEVASVFLYGARRAVETGTPMPDLTGGLAPIIMSIISLVGPVALDQFTRHRERMDQQARGQAPGPFGPPPSPLAPTQDDVSGPRPRENHE